MIRHGDVIRHRVIWVATILTCSSLAACGGSSSPTRGGSSDDPHGPPIPNLSLTAEPETTAPGGFSSLSWSTSGAESCEASGGWSGARSVNGSEDVGPIDSDTTFRLSCAGDGGGVSRETTVRADAGNAARVTLQARPEQVVAGGSSTLTWSSDGTTGCTASGGWSGSRDTSGSFESAALEESTSFSLSCTGTSGTALASVTVEVLDKTLRWQPPTQNVDGTPLTDLAGFNVYWGTRSRSYGTPHVIEDPTATQWEIDDEVPPGTYYFSLTAFDVDGSESGFSNEVIKTLP